MKRRSFVSLLTATVGVLLTGLGLRKEKKTFDPSDLPWRKGRKSQPICVPDILTNEPLQTCGPESLRAPMIEMEDGSPNLPPTQRLDIGQTLTENGWDLDWAISEVDVRPRNA